MSRIGKRTIPIPSGAKVDVSGRKVSVTGPKGTLAMSVSDPISVSVEGGEIHVSRPDDEKRSRALHGLSRALIANMVEGVTNGYKVGMEVYGTGYTSKLSGNTLMINCGFMGRGYGKPAQFQIPIPEGLKVEVQTEAARGESDPAKFSVSGIDKQQVGQFCAEVRKLRKPEPYKGKGIRYAGEQVRRKVGKQFAGGG
ncbi:MAG: 50S ribosomal protein L6 [Phycisphaerae bacterium]